MLWLRQKLVALLGAAFAVVVLLTFVMMLGTENGAAGPSPWWIGLGILMFGSVPILLISWFSDWYAPRFGKARKWVSLLVHLILGCGLAVSAVQSSQGLPLVVFLMAVFWSLDERIRHPKVPPARP